jgi:hypothetical protein
MATAAPIETPHQPDVLYAALLQKGDGGRQILALVVDQGVVVAAAFAVCAEIEEHEIVPVIAELRHVW